MLQASLEVLDEETTQLWWAGKEMVRSKKLKDFIGRNEKTKIIAKLQKKGQGAPAREPVFSEEERKQMMAYAYRKQEEMKVRYSFRYTMIVGLGQGINFLVICQSWLMMYMHVVVLECP